MYKKYGYEKPENVADDEKPYYPPYADESRLDISLEDLEQTLTQAHQAGFNAGYKQSKLEQK